MYFKHTIIGGKEKFYFIDIQGIYIYIKKIST